VLEHLRGQDVTRIFVDPDTGDEHHLLR